MSVIPRTTLLTPGLSVCLEESMVGGCRRAGGGPGEVEEEKG